MISQKLAQRINKGMLSQYPIIYIAGKEENRIEETLSFIAKKKYGEKQPLISWSLFHGFWDTNEMQEPLQALKRIITSQQPAMYLLKDFPAILNDPTIIRAIRDLYYALKNKHIYVFFSYPTVNLPEILNNEIYLVEMALPSETDIHAFFQNFIEANNLTDKLPTSLIKQYTTSLMGLTLNEIGHLLVRLFSLKNQNFEQLLPEIYQEKSQILKKESCLEFISTQQSLEQIGGLDNLKEWVLQRKNLFTEEAFASGLPLPSGILFMGVSGCGKSMAAKAIATAWNVPLVRLDMSLVLSGAYGPAEMAFAHATRIAEEIAPIVLWIDELENSFGYDEQSPGQGNINIFSSFLTWMQDKSPKIFLAATANRINQIPAEMMRKGRFDQLFFLDLPGKDDRIKILTIHIALQGGDPATFDLGYLSAVTDEWSGAEIEQAVKSARIDAFQENRAFTDRDIGHTAANMVPLAKTMSEQIQAIKDWAYNRAVSASKK